MDLTQDQLRAFVGPRAEYYLRSWDRSDVRAASRLRRFNWAAFCLTLVWLLYRRMYRRFLVVLVVLVGWDMVVEIVLRAALAKSKETFIELFMRLAVVERFVPIVFCVILGIFGTHWYYLHARHQITVLTTAGQGDLATITRAGGNNRGMAVLAAVAFLLMYLMNTAPH